jgi:hypothetical protein
MDSRINTYKQNNFIDNHFNAYFMATILNCWFGNYWDDWDGTVPYTIKGEKLVIIGYDEEGYPIYDWVEDYEYDYFPAVKPYDIVTTQEYDIDDYLKIINNPLLERLLFLLS